MNNFTQKHRAHLIILFVLLFITTASTLYLLYKPENQELIINNQEIASPPLAMTNNSSTNIDVDSENASNIAIEDKNIEKGYRTQEASFESPFSHSEESEEFNDTSNKEDLSATTKNLYSITYSLLINNEEYSLDLPSEKEFTVYELMQLMMADSKKPFSFVSKEYMGMGHFVESINDIKNNVKENKFWIYYINDESAKIGISHYKIKEGDIIKWKFEESKF